MAYTQIYTCDICQVSLEVKPDDQVANVTLNSQWSTIGDWVVCPTCAQTYRDIRDELKIDSLIDEARAELIQQRGALPPEEGVTH